jgi:hypothetical protein
MRAHAHVRTSDETRCGCVAANSMAMAPASLVAISDGRSMPAVAITAFRSSIQCSQDGSVSPPASRPDAPIPRRSKITTRLKDPSRRSNRSKSGCSQRWSM